MARNTWGCWTLKGTTLYFKGHWGEGTYYVDLKTCSTSAECLDWIMQVGGKHFAEHNPRHLYNLLEALLETIHPQENLCSFGTDQGKIDVKKILKER